MKLKGILICLLILSLAACTTIKIVPTPVQSPAPIPSASASPIPSSSPSPSPTVSIAPSPSPSPTPTPSLSPSPSPTPTRSLSSSPLPSPSPSPSVIVSPSPSTSPSPIVKVIPILISPAPGSVLAGLTQTFVFSAPGAVSCSLGFGASIGDGTTDWFDSVPCTQVTSGKMPTDGSTVYLRIFAGWPDGTTTDADFTFIAHAPIILPAQPSSSNCQTIGPITGLPYCAYSPTASWNQPLPASPALHPNSAAMITGAFDNYGGRFYANPPDSLGAFPAYFTKAGDPTVTINLTLPYGTTNLSGATVPIPTNAVPALPGDAHMVVLNSTNGNEYDYYAFPQSQPIVQGETISVGFGNITNYQTGSGWSSNTTASGAALLGGLVTVDEFLSGTIHHALAMAPGCNNGAGSVYPATSTATFGCVGSVGNGIPHGSRIWSDLTDAQVGALGFDTVSTMLLKALYHYGGFVTDTNGYWAFDIRNIMEQPLTTDGNIFWHQSGASKGLSINSQPTSFFTTHLHVLQVCVTSGGC